MANKGTIDEIVDPKAVAQIKELTGLLVDARGQLIGFAKDAKIFNDAIGDSKNIKEFESNVTKANKGLNDMASAAEKTKKVAVDAETAKQKAIDATLKKFDKESKAIIEVEKAEISRAKTEKLTQDLQAKGLNQREQIVAKIIEQKVKLGELSDQEKQLNKDLKAGTETTASYTAKMTALNAEQTKLKNTMQADAQAVAQLTRAENAQSGSVNQLRANLDKLRASYNNLSKEERENKDIGGAQLKQIQQLDGEVKGLAESTGNFKDSVGNYAKGLSGPLAGAVQGFELLGGAMFALPVAIVAAGLYGLYKAVILNDDAANKLEGTFLGLKIVVSNAANSFVDFVDKASESKTVAGGLTLIKEGLLSIVPGAKLLELAYKGLVDAQGEVVAIGIQYVAGMDAIEFSTNKSSVAISENELEIQRLATASRDVTKAGEERLAALDKQSAIEAQSTAVSLALTDQKLFLENKLLSQQNKGGKDYEATQYRIFALQVERNNRLKEQEELETSQQKRRASLAKEIAAEEKKIADDAYNLQKQRLEFQRDAQKAIVDDTKQSLEARLAAENAYYKKQQALLDLALKHDLSELEISDTKKTQINERYQNDTIKLETDRAKQVNKIATDSYREAEAEFDKYLSKKEKARIQALKNDLLAIETARDNELAAVTGNTQADADNRIAIEKKYTLLYIDEQIKQAEAAIALHKAAGLTVNEEEAQLAALRRKRTEAGIVDDKKALKTKQQQIQEFLQATSAISQGVFDLLGTLSNNLYNSQIKQIDQIAAQNQKRYDKEKQLIEDSTLSEADKKAKLAILDKKKEAQDIQIAERKKQADIAKAKRDRALQIAQIIAQTAIAVITQLSIPGAGFGLAAAAAAVGALQLAAVLATPLPSYQEGGLVPNTGPARVSEQGRELVYEPDGTMWLTPDTESIVNLNKGARVITHPATEQLLANQTLSPQVLQNNGMDVWALINAGDRNANRIVGALGKKPPIVTYKNGMTIYKTA